MTHGQTELHTAICDRNTDKALGLIERHTANASITAGGRHVSDTDDMGYTALIYAAETGDTRVAKALIDQGVDVNAECHPASTSAHCYAPPTTPLVTAASHGNTAAVTLLLDSGADIEKCIQKRHSPLTAAVSQNHVDVVLTLIEKGACIYALNGYGRSAVQTLDLCMGNRANNATPGSPEDYNAVKNVIESRMGFAAKLVRSSLSVVNGVVSRTGGGLL